MLTKIAGYPEKSTAVPGMAHFAGTGPAGKTCETCQWLGYRRQGAERWNSITNQSESRSYKWHGCAKFKALTGQHGPTVNADNRACKYYEAKPKGDKNAE